MPLVLGTFQDSTSKIFNSLPSPVRNSVLVFTDFKSLLLKHLNEKATLRLNS